MFLVKRYFTNNPFDKYLNSKLVLGLKSMNILKPSIAQESIFPVIATRKDCFLKDETGAGKTLALVLAILNSNLSLRTRQNPQKTKFTEDIQFIFIVPTRELALQIYHWMQELDPDCKAQCVFRGDELDKQDELLGKCTPSILIGTPNRLYELIESKKISISDLQVVVIDEVDRIVFPNSRYATVSQKFKSALHVPVGESLIELIVIERNKRAKSSCQIVVTSATINNPLRRYFLKKNWVTDAAVLDLNTKPPSGVVHKAYYLDNFGQVIRIGADFIDVNDHKYESEKSDEKTRSRKEVQNTAAGFDNREELAASISFVCHSLTIRKALIFVPPQTSVTSFVSILQTMGLKADKIFNVYDYSMSIKPFQKFFDGEVDFVIATELEARGLDISGIDHVIMIGNCVSTQSYIHVSGRTGRFGKSGTCISILPNVREVGRYFKIISQLDIKTDASQE